MEPLPAYSEPGLVGGLLKGLIASRKRFYWVLVLVSEVAAWSGLHLHIHHQSLASLKLPLNWRESCDKWT